MQVSLRDSRSARNDRRWIEGVYRDYLNDLAPAATGIFPALGEVGHREPDQLARWFGDRTAQVLTILYSDEPVGFAMVRRSPPAAAVIAGAAGAGAVPGAPPSANAPEFSMAEFFIARPWRRRGIGAQAVRLLLDRFDGRWLIIRARTQHHRCQLLAPGGFRLHGGQYQERIVNGEVHQRFESGPQRR